MEFEASLQYLESSVESSAPSKIRILHLWPGLPGTAIMGHLETVALSEAPKFEALLRQNINIPTGVCLEGTTNLKLALYHPRKRDEVR